MLEWISCEERNPPEGEEVLVWYARQWPNDEKFFTTGGTLHKAFEDLDKLFWYNGRGEAMSGRVTHWMPLPEPPKC